MAAIHRTFNHPDLTGLFYCDTSYLVGMYLPTSQTYQRFHPDCAAFQQRLYAAPNVLGVTSDWALNEMIYLIQQEHLSRDCQQYNALHGTSLTVETFRRQNPAMLAHSWNEIVLIRAHIERACEIVAIPSTGLTNAALNLIHDFHLRPTDAYHIATAQAYDITNFVSLDRDFLRVDGITLYTCLSP
ncbi:type II toxin-antitoxin system VapC family toxin [Candidatus Poribacteria bacterium]|nr:type II toxin-antitoxin system VapC family toxin [Candidatus Poribacteria bacterium]